MSDLDNTVLFDAFGADADGHRVQTTFGEIAAKYPHSAILTETLDQIAKKVDCVVVVTGFDSLPEKLRFELAQILDAGGTLAVHAKRQADLQNAIEGIWKMLPVGRA